MTDLITRLREAAPSSPSTGGLLQEAATALEENENLQARLDEAEDEVRYWSNR